MLGDQVYMARVTPTVANIKDKSKWEFYAGGHGDSAKWVTGDVSQAKPLVDWQNHTGVVTMTYFAPIKKYVLSISTATIYPMMTHQFDTYFLESDSITGPWSYVTYMSEFGPEAYFVHHPSKFSAAKADTANKTYDAFLMYLLRPLYMEYLYVEFVCKCIYVYFTYILDGAGTPAHTHTGTHRGASGTSDRRSSTSLAT